MTDDTKIIELLLYLFTCGVIIEASYQKLKLLWYRPKEEPAEPEPATETEANQYGPPTEPVVTAKKKPMDPRDELIPLCIGLLVVLAFYPHSIFGFLPFYPRWPWLDVLLTALIVSRGANLTHESYRDFGKMLDGLIGRVWRMW